MRSSRFLLAKVQRKNYYFVDTNVIIGFRDKDYDIDGFINDKNNEFLYTETVLKELNIDQSVLSPHFRFVSSRLTSKRKEHSISRLDKLWHQQFDGMKKQTEKGYGLTPQQLNKFHNDLLIIFEACAACHKRGVLPDDDLRTPPLLTNNMDLLNKFLRRHDAANILEKTINLSGFEHLIPVVNLWDAVDGWRTSL